MGADTEPQPRGFTRRADVSRLREIALDELPRFTRWPARLLGLEGEPRGLRTTESVLREYDRDKYGPLLAAVEAHPRHTRLAPHRDVIERVIVFDALAGTQSDDLLSLMRQRYVQINHYSWDLLEVLEARDDIDMLALEPNLVGPNALLPGSVAVFRFKP